MKCPKCYSSTRVLDSRPDGAETRRKRVCLSNKCKQRFNTIEMIAVDDRPKPVKKPSKPKKPTPPTRAREYWDDYEEHPNVVNLRDLGLK